MECVVGIDLGTSSVKALVCDLQGHTVGLGQTGYEIQTPHVGWAEQDPACWWNAVKLAVAQALEQLRARGAVIRAVKNPRSAGAVGAAVVALIGLGELSSFAAAKDFVRTEREFAPNPKNRAVYDELFFQYRKLYRALSGVYRGANGRRFTTAEARV